ncbi:MAG: hypothetical protein JXQ75_13315 [Phycisphaerae bacterium]|nr:hypothetical protein [Phycisphaerae bacterium]
MIAGFKPRNLMLLCTAICVVAFVPAVSVQADDDIVVVKVKGEGIDKDSAVKDALRHAVEEGGKNEIASRSKTKDFALEYDVVLARASGLVKDYKVLSEKESQGVTTVQIEAKVSKTLIDATWADVAIVLKQLGRPKIMVIFTEIIHDLDRVESNREIIQRSSVLGTQIERKLLKLGFKLVNPGQMKEIDRKKAEVAAMEDDTAALKALASSYGAAIYIKGESRATGPQRTTAAGVKLHMWETDVTIQGFWTETADAIFSNTLVGGRSGSRVAGPPGGRKALEKSGAKLADASVYDMLEAWSRGTMGGGGDIIVEVHNVADIKQAIQIKQTLAGVQGVEEVIKDGVKGTVKYTVVTNMTAETYVEHMIKFTFDGFKLDFEDQKMKTIVCSVK